MTLKHFKLKYAVIEHHIATFQLSTCFIAESEMWCQTIQLGSVDFFILKFQKQAFLLSGTK